ncbi:MAG: tetratricopeptide repeat protein [Bacteroidales bacterium]|nr:tetratricopeptide repeat protein [Bacteroidales bacterium]
MEDKEENKDYIELFDRYVDDSLSEEERQSFEEKLHSDRSFATDFRIYLFTLKGVCQEAEQDNIEFGHAIKHLTKEELLRIIGRSSKPRIMRLNYLRERMAWVASIAAILIIGIFSVFKVHQEGLNRLDNTIVAYYYIPDSNRGGKTITRGWESITSSDIPSLEKAYQMAPTDDIQAQEDAGMRLAMAYLKIHDRKKAKEMLTAMSIRFADDEEFVAQCHKILNQL